MKTKNPFAVEKAEFFLANGTNIVWSKGDVGWNITLYKHNHNSRTVFSVSHLPSIVNAQYFAKEYPLNSNES